MGPSRRDGVHQTDYRVWITGIGITGANLILEVLRRVAPVRLLVAPTTRKAHGR